MVTTSYHNHTVWSDGTPTVREQVDAAAKLGLTEVGISDHFTMAPDNRDVSWSMPTAKLERYLDCLTAIAAGSKTITVRLGLEADYFPETVDALRTRLESAPLDYVIGSVHFVDKFPIDSGGGDWVGLSQDEIDSVYHGYWIRVAGLARSGVFDFLAHPDLPKKFGYQPVGDMSQVIEAALDSIAAADMAIEINTSGWYKPASEAYPKLEILRMARSRNIPLLINSDAHETEHLTRDFGRAAQLAASAGYSELATYNKRVRLTEPLVHFAYYP